MSEKPIIFSGAMVKAILDGRKHMTRRVMRPQPLITFNYPYEVGMRLWVRETWYCDTAGDKGRCIYRADVDSEAIAEPHCWRPSIFMPRWASRITLEVTGVRAERLQNITEGDARAEGITDGGCLNCGNHEPCGCGNPIPDARDAFIWLWDSINGKRPGCAWADNPFVWVIAFRRVEQARDNT